jgi:hypothetical protein
MFLKAICFGFQETFAGIVVFFVVSIKVAETFNNFRFTDAGIEIRDFGLASMGVLSFES